MRSKALTSISAPHLIESYWVVPGTFLAGEYPARTDFPDAAQRLDALLASGINIFFDLTEPDELPPYRPLLEQRAALSGTPIGYERFPMVDFGLPQRPTMLALLDSIDAALAGGRTIYVHCRGGLGRTGMAVGCYLVRHGTSAEAALQQIAEFWRSRPGRRFAPVSPETPAQMKFVRDWNEPGLAVQP